MSTFLYWRLDVVIVCSAIIHTDLTTTGISNQYRDASHGPARPAKNMQHGNAERHFVSRVGKIIGNARFSEIVNIKMYNITSK